MAGAAPERKQGASNTRRFPRYAIDVRVSVEVFREGMVSYFWGRSRELGQDGMGATLTGDLEKGDVVSLEFPLPLSPYPVKVRAIVRYRDGLYYGFEFLALKPEQRAVVERACEMLQDR
jgi:PilZ domain